LIFLNNSQKSFTYAYVAEALTPSTGSASDWYLFMDCDTL